jgi:hypothetical protein
MPLPVGLVYDEDDRVVLEPDQQVQESLRVFFETFERTGSAWATVRAFRRQSLKFPRRGQAGTGEITWRELTLHIALDTLHNPRYAGVFCFGRTRGWKDGEGKRHFQQLPREQWRFLKQDAHPGYITWDRFLTHQERLIHNHQAHGGWDRPAGPPREGPALLQGLVLCGKCGRPMTVRYHQRGGRLTPDYVCDKDRVEKGKPSCQIIPGGGVDEAVGTLLVQSVTPLALEVALNVQQEVQSRLDEADRLRQLQVERAQYEADRARLRYMRVDPNNRLVADTLETQWNEKLRLLEQAKEDYQKQCQRDAAQITVEQRARILALASDFPKLWLDPKTLDRDRKRMARLLLEDVTLQRDREILAQVRFRGGATRELRLPLPLTGWALRQTKPEIITEIDRLLDDHTAREIVPLLNERGWHTSSGSAFNVHIINRLRWRYGLKNRQSRLREQGWLTAHELALLFECSYDRINHWRKIGLLEGITFSDKVNHLYRRPSESTIALIKSRQRKKRSQSPNSEPSL